MSRVETGTQKTSDLHTVKHDNVLKLKKNVHNFEFRDMVGETETFLSKFYQQDETT